MKKRAKRLHFYKLIFAYDGSRFGGSAKQPGKNCVQNVLDAALLRLGAQPYEAAKLADKARDFGVVEDATNCALSGDFGEAVASAKAARVISVFASRTDANVHALTNVAKAAFAYELDIPYALRKINAECPGIWLRHIAPCAPDFQPRFDALMRSYRYVFRLKREQNLSEFGGILQDINLCEYTPKSQAVKSGAKSAHTGKNLAFLKAFSAELPDKFVLDKFIQAVRSLRGEHDFCQLCLNANEAQNTRKNILNSRVYLHDNLLIVNIFSTGFLRGQIRLIMGAILAYAAGKISFDEWLKQLNGERAFVRLSAPASGLYLKSIYYK